MAKEIERKFLVNEQNWGELGDGSAYKQGYIPTSGKAAVRARVAKGKGFLTIKGPSDGATRAEFEYEIPVQDASEIIDSLCLQPAIEKTRYKIKYAEMIWEVDVFDGENAGLTLAEVELEHENQEVELPDWIREEVTDDERYSNAYLAQKPFKKW